MFFFTKTNKLFLIFRSEFLETAVTSDFKEKAEKRIELPYSTRAIEQFVKFLYGFELEDESSLEVVKDLIKMGGVYSVPNLQNAASMSLPKLLTRCKILAEITQMMDFAKTHQATAALELCTDFITTKYQLSWLQSNDLLHEYPEIAVRMLRGKNLKMNTIDIYEIEKVYNYRMDSPVIHEILISQSKRFKGTIAYTGLGITLSSGAEVDVSVSSNGEELYKGKLINLKKTGIVPIYFNQELHVRGPKVSFTVLVTGSGSGYSGYNVSQEPEPPTFEIENCKDSDGRDSDERVTFSLSGASFYEIPQIYFHIDKD